MTSETIESESAGKPAPEAERPKSKRKSTSRPGQLVRPLIVSGLKKGR